MGGRLRLRVQSAPGVRRIIAQTPGRFRARGSAPTSVGVVPPPLGLPFRGGIKRAAAGAIPMSGGGTVVTTIVICGAIGGKPLRSRLVILLRSLAGPAVRRMIISARTVLSPAPVALTVPSRGGGGSSVRGLRGSSQSLCGHHRAAIIPELSRAPWRYLGRRSGPSDRIRDGVGSSGLVRQLRGHPGGRTVFRAVVQARHMAP